MGYDTLKSVTIRWKVNNVLEHLLFYRIYRYHNIKTPILLVGNYLPTLGGLTQLIAWVENPNGNMDENVFNDTITTSSLGCNRILNGNYTVGGSGADFASIAQVFLELTTCGISGNVTFLLRSGTYNESIHFQTNIPGMTINDTITFTSLAQHADSVILFSYDTAVTLGIVNNIVLSYLTIDVTQGKYGILFTNACENIEINHCIIKCDTTATSYAGIFKDASSGVVHNIRILNNKIDGGNYNIYFIGGKGTSEFSNNNIINNNILTNAYRYGAYLKYSIFANISNNSIYSRTTHLPTSYYGLYINYCNANAISANKVHVIIQISDVYGMYLDYTNYYNAVSSSLISNNELIINAKSNNSYGMYVYNSKVNIYHNSIHLNASAAAKGLYAVTSTIYPIAIRQNNIGSYSSMVYPMYLPNLNGLTLNNNNYYGSYIGYV